MILREFFKHSKLFEGGNLEIDGAQAQQIDLKVHNRAYIIPILNTLLNSINSEFQQRTGGPLWNPKVLKSRKYLSGSSLHFFNTDISDDEFERIKPKVGDIDTQVNKEVEPQLSQWLESVKGQVVGNAKFLGYSRGNEQYSSLWELTDPPIKVQIDFEFVEYSEKDEPTDWAGFSHSSSWDDLSQGIKGVFHKFLIQSLSKMSSKDFIFRKTHARTGKVTDKVENDSMITFAVSSKEGGGLRPKYKPVLDNNGKPLEIDGLPVLKELPTIDYERDISKIFQTIFDKRIDRAELAKVLPNTWSFTGLLDIMNVILTTEEKEQVLDSFVDKLFAPGAQGLYKGDPERDLKEKNTALNYALKVLDIAPPKNLEQMRQDYVKNYKVTTEGPVGLDSPIDEADEQQPVVKAQLRKGMPHLRDLKPADFLDLVDELHSEGGRFKLENIPLNVKIDGFGGRFGKNASGAPFMGTSRTEPRYKAGFLKYRQEKGTTDPEVLNRAKLFDDLFDEMMTAIKAVDSKLGPDFLVDKQVTCEVLFLPFATQTEEGKLKFVGIEYDQLPKGVNLVLVPFRVVKASTGEDVPDNDEIIKSLTDVGQSGSVMFISNRLKQKQGLDVTEIIDPLDNIEELKNIVAGTSGKRDRASIQLRKEIEEKLKPVQIALEKAIDEDPNIIGKDLLGKNYEGIVINSRLGPIKVTSQQQKDIIAKKNAARAATHNEQPRQNVRKTAVVAIGSFIGHKGHEELFNYTINKAEELGGDPYLFIGNAEGKDDPIPTSVKVETWHKLYPEYAQNISAVMQGGSLIQKIKHELINPLPGKPPRYDNIIIMVGEDRAGLTMPAALMKSVNKFPGYEHVKVSLDVTPRGTGISGTMLRNSLKNESPEKALETWSNAFDVKKLGISWIKHLMDVTRKGMGIIKPEQKQQSVSETRLFNALIRNNSKVNEELEYSKRNKLISLIHKIKGWGTAELSLLSDEELLDIVKGIKAERSKDLDEKMMDPHIFAGYARGQKPGDMWRGTDKGPPGNKAFGESTKKGVAEGKLSESELMLIESFQIPFVNAIKSWIKKEGGESAEAVQLANKYMNDKDHFTPNDDKKLKDQWKDFILWFRTAYSGIIGAFTGAGAAALTGNDPTTGAIVGGAAGAAWPIFWRWVGDYGYKVFLDTIKLIVKTLGPSSIDKGASRYSKDKFSTGYLEDQQGVEEVSKTKKNHNEFEDHSTMSRAGTGLPGNKPGTIGPSNYTDQSNFRDPQGIYEIKNQIKQSYKEKSSALIPVSEDIQKIFDTLINKIIINEAIQDNK